MRKRVAKNSLRLMAAAALVFCAQGMAQVTPVADGGAAAPDEWLLAKTGPRWFQITQPSPNLSTLNTRAPSVGEKPLVDRARALVGQRPAKAFGLMDGNTIVYSAFNAPADSESLFFGMSMGKTVTAMAVGQAICAGKVLSHHLVEIHADSDALEVGWHVAHQREFMPTEAIQKVVVFVVNRHAEVA